jgi:dolichol-phosphate mannosyltransferase
MDDLKLSIVMPAHNEEGSIVETLEGLLQPLLQASIPFEVIVVDDGSSDSTGAYVMELAGRYPEIRLVRNAGRHGFGMAVRLGLERFTGDAVAVMMADGSDSPLDLIRYYRKLQEGFECVFGSRFMRGGRVIDYPKHKLVLNRVVNNFIRLIFGFRYNDVTNAFKCYRREVIEGIQPLISPHFNLTVEMPLKAIIRRYSYDVIPMSWTNRKTGFSKLKLQEMGSRYLFIVLYLWLEQILSRGDYHRHRTLEHTASSKATHV